MGWKLPKRIKHLADLQKPNGQKATYNLYFQGDTRELARFKVPIDLPKYRLANIRTKAIQSEHIAEHTKLKKNFFKVDPESDEVQSVQHDLLKKLVDDKKLKNYFKSRKQEQPIILDDKGFVVNGNRRLCAWRELLEEKPSTYSRFRNIEIVVLPRCSEEDILDLEAYLQIHEDIRADYTWVAKGLAYRELREYPMKFSDNKIGNIYQEKPNEVRAIIDALDYAEEYLESIGEPNKYYKVEKDELGFKKIVENRKKLNSSVEKESFKTLSFLYISNPEGLGRTYQAVTDIKNFLPSVETNLKSEFSIPDGVRGNQKLNKMLKNDKQREEVHNLLCETILDGRNRSKIKASKNLTLKEIKKASTSLINAISGYRKNSNLKGLDDHIKSIESSLQKIKKWI